ncbi:hypothetical protein MPSEU_000360700 [Mayamaea pseudoterrestris]|nr:hypothetical protein MPSEU_000360700 [Mayamaea pseudoterrestris]
MIGSLCVRAIPPHIMMLPSHFELESQSRLQQIYTCARNMPSDTRASRPDPSAIPELHAQVLAQAKNEAPYTFDAVRMLVKLYQLFPTSSSSSSEQHQESIALSCLLALREYPNMTDYLALVYMVPPNVMGAELCAAVQICADALDACHYAAFWKQLLVLQSCENANIATLAKQSVQAFQIGIVSVVALTYKQAPAAMVAKLLNVESMAAVSSLLTEHDAVESVADDLVTFTPTSDNVKRERVFQESVGFDAITSLMSKLSQ